MSLYTLQRERDSYEQTPGKHAVLNQSAKDPQHTACPFSLIATALASNSVNRIAQISALIGAYVLGEIPSHLSECWFWGFFFKASYHPDISSPAHHSLSGLPFFLASCLALNQPLCITVCKGHPSAPRAFNWLFPFTH